MSELDGFSLARIDRQRAENHLAEFIRQAWPINEPGTPYLHNWHIDLICEYLEAVDAGEILRLLISQPPRTMKSFAATVMFPCWRWIRRPEMRWMFASYAAQLAIEHSLFRRRILESDWYRANWPHVRLTSDQNVKTAYENDRRGKMTATSIGGSAMGMGGNCLVVDDALNTQEAHSDIRRAAANEFFDTTLAIRLNDKRRDAIIVIGQRLHEDDLPGHILARDEDHEWTHLCIPEHAAERTIVHFPHSGREVVREAGDILWPEREGLKELASVRVLMGTHDYEAQFNQTPAPPGGIMFHTDWWRFYLRPPRLQDIIQSWDMTFKDAKDSDFVVGQVWGRIGAEKYLLDEVRAQADFPATLRMFRLLTSKWPQAEAKLVEDTANGPAVISTLKREIPGIIPITPKGGKPARAAAVTATIEAGNVYLPALSLDPLRVEPWVAEFIDEHSRFPNSAHDDRVDACTQALARLNKPMLVAETCSE